MDYHALHSDSMHSTLPVIGWTGTHTTVDYLKPIVPALEKLAAIHAFEFVVISNEPPSFLIPNLRFVRWNKSTEIEDLSQFSIGVMPLEDTEWAKGKCGFKALQYMALGIPTIAANVGVNSTIITHGQDGFIAMTTEDWFEYLNNLLSDPSQGRMLGTNAQTCIRNRFSVQANQEKYRSLFTS
jgi:glycosyltransferase involved in cell wall biosynthesis